jgi:hypothetical protein
VATLVQEMKQSSIDAKITVIPYRMGATMQRYTASVSTWLHHVSSSLFAALRWCDRSPAGIIQYNVSGQATTTGVTNASNPQHHQDPVHLMACVHRGHNDRVLLQVDAHAIRNDQALFSLLRTQITQRRNRLLRAVCCRSIQEILFSKVSGPIVIDYTRRKLT